eukprot:Pgem_evm1s7668
MINIIERRSVLFPKLFHKTTKASNTPIVFKIHSNAFYTESDVEDEIEYSCESSVGSRRNSVDISFGEEHISFTYSDVEYDRTFELKHQTNADLRQMLDQLTLFKKYEMEVHQESKIFTNFHSNIEFRREFQTKKLKLLRKQYLLEQCNAIEFQDKQEEKQIEIFRAH